MSYPQKTTIVTGASQGIGAGIVKAFGERGFNVVANSGKVTQSTEVAALNHVALVDGHIGEPATAAKIVETALSRFKSIDALVNNAGIFFTSRRGLHGRALQVARLNECRALPVRHPTFHQANVNAEDRREHRHDHDVPCSQSRFGALRRRCR
jgi:NAD(P)-dependent dehydrogenase (short-subunit alcohol dehydrogenase family)